MRQIGIAAFTDQGRALARRIVSGLEDSYEILWYEKGLKQWCGTCFTQAEALIFIGACGIAVRTIAPFLKSKTEDPAVVVLDEAGQYVISLLSGHIGGANEFALRIAGLTGAVPVITTASDVRGKIAVDVFAKQNHLHISDMKAAKEIAAAILREETVNICCTGIMEGTVPPELTVIPHDGRAILHRNQSQRSNLIWVSEYLSDEQGLVLHLIPRVVTIGIGCRRGKSAAEIEQAVKGVLSEEKISTQAVLGAASIDLKKDEEGILATCRKLGIPFTVFSAEELSIVKGEFVASEFVRKTTGVDNVCERAALALAGNTGMIIRKKYARNGVTVALAVREWRIHFGN